MWLAAGAAEPRQLPQAGGVADQAALMLEAFKVIAAGYFAWMRENPPKKT